MSMPSTLAERIQKPKIRAVVLGGGEIFIVLAAVICLWTTLNPGPLQMMLFLFVGQPFIIIGIACYLGVTITDFLRRRGVVPVHFAAGETVFRQGEPGDFVYTITQGEVDVIQEGPQGEERVLARLGPGAYFGEMALISNAPRNATVRAVTEVDAVTLAQSDFVNLYAYMPDLQRSVKKIIKQRRAATAARESS